MVWGCFAVAGKATLVKNDGFVNSVNYIIRIFWPKISFGPRVVSTKRFRLQTRLNKNAFKWPSQVPYWKFKKACFWHENIYEKILHHFISILQLLSHN